MKKSVDHGLKHEIYIGYALACVAVSIYINIICVHLSTLAIGKESSGDSVEDHYSPMKSQDIPICNMHRPSRPGRSGRRPVYCSPSPISSVLCRSPVESLLLVRPLPTSLSPCSTTNIQNPSTTFETNRRLQCVQTETQDPNIPKANNSVNASHPSGKISLFCRKPLYTKTLDCIGLTSYVGIDNLHEKRVGLFDPQGWPACRSNFEGSRIRFRGGVRCSRYDSVSDCHVWTNRKSCSIWWERYCRHKWM